MHSIGWYQGIQESRHGGSKLETKCQTKSGEGLCLVRSQGGWEMMIRGHQQAAAERRRQQRHHQHQSTQSPVCVYGCALYILKEGMILEMKMERNNWKGEKHSSLSHVIIIDKPCFYGIIPESLRSVAPHEKLPYAALLLLLLLSFCCLFS